MYEGMLAEMVTVPGFNGETINRLACYHPCQDQTGHPAFRKSNGFHIAQRCKKG